MKNKQSSGKYTFICSCGYTPKNTTSISENISLMNLHNKICYDTIDLNDYKTEFKNSCISPPVFKKIEIK